MDELKKKYKSFTDKYGLSGSVIKLIAMITMLIDHTALLLGQGTDWYIPFRCIGRLSFPLFAFLISEGMAHTKDINRYALRVGIFALASEVPFTYVTKGTMIYIGSCNIFFTYLIPILIEVVTRRAAKSEHARMYQGIALLAGVFAAYFFGTEYGYIGVILVYLLYTLRNFGAITYILAAVYMFLAWFNSGADRIQLIGAASVVFMLLYNGQRGFIRGRLAQIGSYAFYPVHLLGLYLISLL